MEVEVTQSKYSMQMIGVGETGMTMVGGVGRRYSYGSRKSVL